MIIKRRTTFFFFASLGAFVSLIFTGVAIVTSHWINAQLQKNTTGQLDPAFPLKDYLGNNPIQFDPDDPGAFLGLDYFGLFQGCKKFNYGFGAREWNCYKVFSEHANVYSVGYPIAVFVCLTIAITFALVSTIFGLVNTLTVPIKTFHGPMGLYLWNAIGAIGSFLAWLLYLILYLTQLTTNVLTKADMDPPNNFRTTSVSFGYSYWLALASFVLFLLNIFFVFLAHLLQEPDLLKSKKKKSEPKSSKGTGNNNVGLGLMY
ncbi:clarin-2-like [Acanthaster planci]|uniref:Clarin-2-like n=1 Tax=Acanthaster planci TaxID=133434 RepID=A0A8B7ZNV4_ACAPL|nr:clarin-2-like [Acanthaster planci]